MRITCILSVVFLAAAAFAANWPGWRGDGSGVSREAGLPVAWGAGQNIVWRAPLPGEGSSSPIVWGGRVFLTASANGGKTRLLLCLNAADGSLRWQREIATERVPKTDPKSGYAAPTPVTDGRRVYAFFDCPGLVAYDLDGNPCWTLPLGPFASPYNMANSPILYKDSVILCCDQEKDSFILAADCATGAVRWRTPRKLGFHYSTPLLIDHHGVPQVVVTANIVKAYNPDTGAELWSCKGLNPTVVPSPVYADGLLYATSGRNGPAMAIDPSGQGDISESGLRMQVAIGGPYVPSPLACPLLVLPGDDGNLRAINAKGAVVVNERLRAHFTASPVVGGGNIYWPAENGDTYVIDARRLAAVPPSVKVIAVNKLGEQCLASPAIAGGRLYLRTAKALYCIAGGGAAAAPTGLRVTETFAELKTIFDAHPAPDGPDIPFRLEVVEKLALLKDPQAIPFLKDVALKDAHWDVGEAAVKALAGYDDPAAVPALLAMFADWRTYLKSAAAMGLGRMHAAEAVPTLVKAAAGDRDPLTRVACVQALTEIARAKETAAILPALCAGVADADGTVRAAAARGLAALAAKAGGERERAVTALLTAATEKNPLVAAAGREGLAAYHVPDARLAAAATERLLYGAPRPPAVVKYLAAGPVRLKFQDGELRYLYVGNREIIRRVYFAVRDKGYDTVMPVFSAIDVKTQKDGFTIHLEAACTGATADYRWTGDITGTADGTITFRVEGKAGRAFPSPRVGLNILFGCAALAGKAYEGTTPDGKAQPAVFPLDVTPGVLAPVNFSALRYATGGLQVTCRMTGGGFGLEDQRNYGDSSYKAYHALGYARGADIPAGEVRSDTLTIAVQNARPQPAPAGPVVVALVDGPPIGKLPKLLPAEQTQKGKAFSELSNDRGKYADATALTWAFNPAAHLPDDDMLMENLPAVIDQARAARAFAPKATTLRVDPIGFDAQHPRPARDPRNTGLFAAAWSAALVNCLAQARVDEAVFTLPPGPAAPILTRLAAAAGQDLLPLTVVGPLPSPVTAFAYREGAKTVLCLVNLTAQPQAVKSAQTVLTLAPYEVRWLEK